VKCTLCVALFLLLFGVTKSIMAQGTEAFRPVPPTAFELATVKPVDESKPKYADIRVYPGGRLLIRSQSAHALIAAAFDLSAWQVIGGDAWTNERLYDIDAKPPEDVGDHVLVGEYTARNIEDYLERSMLQSLLTERFHLKHHFEKVNGPIFVLQRSDRPLQLHRNEVKLYETSDDGAVSPTSGSPTGSFGFVLGRPLSFHRFSMHQLARSISSIERAPVVDRTDLTGFYDFDSKTAITREDMMNGGVVSVLNEAVSDAGLKLTKSQGVIDRLIVDHIELPTEN
jgi:uncharacterized protein (TIGR03435 family)